MSHVRSILKIFGPNSKLCICQVRNSLGHVSGGLALYIIMRLKKAFGLIVRGSAFFASLCLGRHTYIAVVSKQTKAFLCIQATAHKSSLASLFCTIIVLSKSIYTIALNIILWSRYSFCDLNIFLLHWAMGIATRGFQPSSYPFKFPILFR